MILARFFGKTHRDYVTVGTTVRELYIFFESTH